MGQRSQTADGGFTGTSVAGCRVASATSPPQTSKHRRSGFFECISRVLMQKKRKKIEKKNFFTILENLIFEASRVIGSLACPSPTSKYPEPGAPMILLKHEPKKYIYKYIFTIKKKKKYFRSKGYRAAFRPDLTNPPRPSKYRWSSFFGH